MIKYLSAFKWEDGICLGEVLDFPGTVACGETLEQARRSLAEALRDMAETNLLRGEALPLPNPVLVDPEAELLEPIYLIFQAGQRVEQHIAVPIP